MPAALAPAEPEIPQSLAIVPQGLSGDLLRKAHSGGLRPEVIKHNRSEAARRYMHFGLGIMDDTTPHLDSNMLRRVAEKCPVLAGVLKTLLNQWAEHFRKPESEKGLGVRVVQKDRKKALTEPAAKMAEHISNVLFRGGLITEHPVTGEPAVWDGHYEQKADPLSAAVRRMAYDSLVLDKVFIEVEGSTRIGGKSAQPIMYWKPADAGLVRMVDTKLYDPQIRKDLKADREGWNGKVSYVMLDPMDSQFSVMREYAWNEGALGFRNPRTEFGTFGYGKSEVEECLDAIVGILYGMQANKEYFTSNHVPLGILNLVGNYGEPALNDLRSHFKQSVGTPEHYYEFPVIASQAGSGSGAQWVPLMDRSRQDLIFKVYLELCTVLVSAVFQIQPEEMGFSSFGGSSSSLNSPDPESTFTQSQHKGLLPKVLWMVDFLTRNVAERIDPDFEIVVQGLEQRYSQEQLLQAQYEGELLQNGYTFNMIRRRADEPPAVDPLDMDLWRDTEKKMEGKWFPNDTLRTEAVIEAYKKAGGKLGDIFDSPIGNPQAMQLWSQQHGIQQEQETGDDMRQTANNERAGAQADDAADAQGARDGLTQMQQANDERDSEKSALEEQDRQAGSLRIPQADDASRRFGGGGNGGGMNGSNGARRPPAALAKSYAEARRSRTYTIGPRDG